MDIYICIHIQHTNMVIPFPSFSRSPGFKPQPWGVAGPQSQQPCCQRCQPWCEWQPLSLFVCGGGWEFLRVEKRW